MKREREGATCETSRAITERGDRVSLLRRFVAGSLEEKMKVIDEMFDAEFPTRKESDR
jgi:hypothetical protein